MKVIDASGTIFEVYDDANGNEIFRAQRPPILLWDNQTPTVAINTDLTLHGQMVDFEGINRTTDNTPNFKLMMASPAGDIDAVPCAIANGVATIVINFAVPGDYMLHSRGGYPLIMQHLHITVTGPRVPTALKGVTVTQDSVTGKITVTRNGDDTGSQLQNALANYLGGTALTAREQQGLLLAIAQKLGIL